MYHSSINRRRIDWWKNISDILPFPTDASQKCYSTGKSGISVRLASTRKCQELFRMGIIPILCIFIPNLFVHNVNCLVNLLRGNLSIINCWTYLEISKISLYPPPLDLWKPPILPPDLQFSLDWQDFEGSDRLLHGIWENDFNLDVSLKWVMLHQAKLKFPGKLAISNTKNANLQIDVFRCFLAFFYVILCERSLSRLF